MTASQHMQLIPDLKKNPLKTKQKQETTVNEKHFLFWAKSDIFAVLFHEPFLDNISLH